MLSGRALDIEGLQVGAVLPFGHVDTFWIKEGIHRADVGTLSVPVLLPSGTNPEPKGCCLLLSSRGKAPYTSWLMEASNFITRPGRRIDRVTSGPACNPVEVGCRLEKCTVAFYIVCGKCTQTGCICIASRKGIRGKTSRWPATVLFITSRPSASKWVRVS